MIDDQRSDPPPVEAAPRTRRAITALAGLSAAVFVVHFGFTLLYNAPVNPVSLAMTPVTDRWMHPFFEQNWQLFAPKPLSSDNGVLVRARVRTEDGLVTTDYVDVTTPAVEAAHARHPFQDRTARQLTYATFQLEVRDPIFERVRDHDDHGAAAIGDDYALAREDHRERGLTFIRSLASIEAERLWGDGVEEIQVRLVTHEFPRFSQRHKTDEVGDIYFEELPWMPRREEAAS